MSILRTAAYLACEAIVLRTASSCCFCLFEIPNLAPGYFNRSGYHSKSGNADSYEKSHLNINIIMASSCSVCGQEATKICSACKKVSYCSIEHQKKDWKVHKSSCRIYIVKKCEEMGRYIVAAKDIPAGTIIIDEAAVMVGPKQSSLPICLGCHKSLKRDCSRCSKCGYPVCNSTCEKIPIHANYECPIFSQKKPIVISDFSKRHPLYECILTLRCLLLQTKDPPRWEKLTTLEHHNSLRQQMTGLWNRNETNTVNFLRDVFKLDFDPMLIHSVLGYADVNSFEIKTSKDVSICGMYPEASLMAHSCVSNTHHSSTDDFRMILRSSVPIKKGEMITTIYTHTLEGTIERREHILAAKLFACNCFRCASPTELDTHMSSLKCLACPHGLLLSQDPLKPKSPWICTHCKKPVPVEAIRSIVTSIQEEIENVENDGTRNPVPRFEDILKKYSGIKLHPHHFLMIDVIHSLTQFYGKIKGYAMEDLTIAQIQRKKDLCEDLLTVLDVIEPGLSRIRGMTLYELHSATFFLAQQKFKSGLMDKKELKIELEKVIQLLQASRIILEFDSPTSSTGQLALSIPVIIGSVREIMDHFCGRTGTTTGTITS